MHTLNSFKFFFSFLRGYDSYAHNSCVVRLKASLLTKILVEKEEKEEFTMKT